MKTLLSLYLFLAIILAQFCAAYFFSKSRANYRKAFSALVLCISVYLFGFLMIINSTSLEEMVFWNQLQYLGLPFVSVLWLIVALLYTKVINPVKNWVMLLLFIVPVVTFLIRLTNPWHHFFYTGWALRSIFGHHTLYMERGFWYYVNITYTLLCLLSTVIIYLLGYLKNQAGYSKTHFMVFLFASLFPFIGIILVILVFHEQTIDYAALIMPVSLLIIGYGIWKYDFLEIRSLARETIFENNFVGMVILGPGQRIVDYNRAAEEFFNKLGISLGNYPIERLLGREPELLDIFSSKVSQRYSAEMDGEERFFEINAVPLGDSDDVNIKMLKSIRDVTEEKRIQDKLTALATTDSLSGLYNRREFLSLAQKAFACAKEINEGIAVLMMDLDYFKTVNDTFGHAAGDEVIRQLGRAIKTCFRKNDIAGRIGGEEFAVVLKNASLAEATKAAEQFRTTVAGRKVVFGDQEITFTISIGVAATGEDTGGTNNIEEIIRKADDALYRAKAMGRNRVAVWDQTF